MAISLYFLGAVQIHNNNNHLIHRKRKVSYQFYANFLVEAGQ